VKNFRANPVFMASASCSKIRIQGTLVFSGQTQSCSKTLNDKKYIQYNEKFQGKRNLLKTSGR